MNVNAKREEIMKRFSAAIAALFLIGSAVAYSQHATAQANNGWIALFDGKSLNGWSQIGDANWRVEDGAIVTDKGKGYLVSDGSYTDYEIRAEFWVSDDANTGVFIRCTDPTTVNSKTGYEVNIFDQRPDPSYGTGAIVDVAKAATVLKTGGKWNTYEIIVKGPKFTVTLNGVRTVEGAEDSRNATGRVALQGFAGTIKFRKVDLKPL
jgi:Domain of Unknown Function (DUF1080)